MTLLALIVWPLLSAFFLFAMGALWPSSPARQRAAQVVNIVANLCWAFFLIAGWKLAAAPGSDGHSFPVSFDWYWLPILKSHFSLAIDGLNLSLIALNVFLSISLAFYAYGKEKLGAAYLGLFSLLNAASVGSLLAADALTFYIFWEAMLIPMYFMIGRWGGSRRVYAALKFFAFTMLGSLPLLLALIALAYEGNVASLGWHDLVQLKLPFTGWLSLHGLCFIGFLCAFAVKIPLWPLHVWLPDAHSEAPTGGSVILAGVLLKLGVYGILRWCLPLFPGASHAIAPLMMVLACAGIVLGSFAAWQQKDIKRLIAYSSVAHLGFMVLGVFAFREEAMQGALFQNIAHGLSTGALFLLFGIIYDRTHSRELRDYGGLAAVSPVVSAFFVFATMASIALPGLPGFVGEFLVLSGTFVNYKWAALIALAGVVLGAVYMLGLVRKMVFGPTSTLVSSHPVRLDWNEWIAVLPFILLMLVLGFLPQLLLVRSEGAVQLILQGLR